MARWRALLTIAGASLAAATLSVAPAAQAAPKLLGQGSLDGSFEDGASDVTPDSSGNGVDLKAPLGGVHLGKTGARYGNGGTLATNLTPMQGTSPVLAPAQVTLLAWVKQSGFPGSLRYVAGRGDDGLTCGGSSYAIYTGYPGMEGLRFYVRYANTSALSDAAPQAVFDGGWHLVAGTYDGATLRFYVDGVLVGAPKPAPGPLNYSLSGGNTFYADGYAVEGCALFNNADDWPGAIDEVRVYDTALSPAELTRLATSTGPAAPLLISDESLIVTPPAPGPVESPQQPQAPAAPAAEVAQKIAKPVDKQALAEAVAAVEGTSKKAPTKALEAAIAGSQQQALEALKSQLQASQVGKAQAAKELSAAEAKKTKADQAVQERMASLKYGITAEIPAAAVGQAVAAVATVVLEKKSGGKVTTQEVVLPVAVGIAKGGVGGGGSAPRGGAGEATAAEVQFPVDQKATAAMTRADVSKAAISIQAVAVDPLGDLTVVEQQRLQQYMDRRSKATELLSNVLKKLQDTQEQIAKNIRGGVTDTERKQNQQLESKAQKLDKDAKKIEQQRDEANQKAAQATQAAVAALVQGVIAGTTQVAGAAQGNLPTASAALTGCKVCALGAVSSG